MWGCDVDTQKEKQKLFSGLSNVVLAQDKKNKMDRQGDKRRSLERRVGEEGTVIKTIRQRKAIWPGHVLRRNCLLLDVIEATDRRYLKDWQKRNANIRLP